MRNNNLLGSLVGLAVGDAVGTTVEFRERDTFAPVTDMIGQGPFNLPAGYYTDDTSMALCLAHSLVEYPDLNKVDLLQRFSRWFRKGEHSPTGRCFDIGTTTRVAIVNFEKDGSITNNNKIWDAGNGSIMRLAPVVLKHNNDVEKAVTVAKLQSETTHASEECLYACEMLVRMLYRASEATSKADVLTNLKTEHEDYNKFVDRILSIIVEPREGVSSSGYVVDTLEAAVWSFHNTDNFEDAILLAVNLGGDADTVGAVTGQIAGTHYGLDNIPLKWLDTLYKTDELIELGNKLINE